MSATQLKKSDLVNAVAEQTGADKKTVTSIIDALGDVVVKEVSAGNSVVLPNIGKFQSKDRAARTVRNPSTGETMQKDADRTVRVVVAKAFKDAMN